MRIAAMDLDSEARIVVAVDICRQRNGDFLVYRCSDTSLRMVSFLSAMPSISTTLPA